MKFCSECGSPVDFKYIDSDQIRRHVCISCQKVHYQNPNIIAGCIAEYQGKILLCRRSIEPKVGTWSFPAGFMENGETIEMAATREVFEETGADVEVDSLYSIFAIPQISQVYIVYRGRLRTDALSVGYESQEVAIFDSKDIPWDNMFYPAIADILRRYLNETREGQYGIYTGSHEQGKVAMIEKERR